MVDLEKYPVFCYIEFMKTLKRWKKGTIRKRTNETPSMGEEGEILLLPPCPNTKHTLSTFKYLKIIGLD